MRIVNGIIYAVVLVLFFLVQKKTEHSRFLKYVKSHVYILGVLLLVNSLSFIMTFQNGENTTFIEKEGYNGEEKQVDFVLQKEDKTEEISLTVRPKKLTKKEQKKKMKEAFSYLEKNMKGENNSLLEVKESLDFLMDYEKYPFDAEFQPEDYALVDGEGDVRNEKDELLAAGYTEKELRAGIKSSVTVLLWYGEECEKKTFEIKVFPKEEKGTRKYFSEVIKIFQKKEEEALYKDGFTLPLKVKGVTIKEKDGGGPSPAAVLFVGMILSGLLLLKEQEEKKQAEIKKKELLLRCYPWFVNELVLLLGAGMQMKNIFRVLLAEYKAEQERNEHTTGKKKRNKGKHTDYREPLMKEIEAAKNSIDLGMSEEEVYYRLGRRLKLPCYIKLMTLLEQNVKKGAKGLKENFEQEELAALEERKNLAKRYGEEAGTKLLGPMVLLLVVIMFMILIPAFLSFGI